MSSLEDQSEREDVSSSRVPYFERHYLVKCLFRQVRRDMLSQVRPPAGTVESMAHDHRTQVKQTVVRSQSAVSTTKCEGRCTLLG
jgi:hypothetical protein